MTEDKTKVKDLATELGVPTKNLLQALRELDIPAKSTSSNIAAEDIDRVKNHPNRATAAKYSPASLSVAAASPPRTLRPKAKKRPARNAGPRVKTTRPRPALSACPARPRHRTPRPSPLRNPKRRPLRKFPCRNR